MCFVKTSHPVGHPIHHGGLITSHFKCIIYDALRDLVPSVQFKKCDVNDRVIILVKLHVEACNFTKNISPSWVFFTFLKLNEWYQIVQSITYILPINRSAVLPTSSDANRTTVAVLPPIRWLWSPRPICHTILGKLS